MDIGQLQLKQVVLHNGTCIMGPAFCGPKHLDQEFRVIVLNYVSLKTVWARIRLCLYKQKWAGEMVEEEKVLTTKTNGLSLTLVIQMVELTHIYPNAHKIHEQIRM